MNQQDVMRAIFEAIAEKSEGPEVSMSLKEAADALLERLESMNRRYTFEPGQIVRYKKGLQNRRSAGPFIVCRMLEEPIIAQEYKSGSPYYREPMDMVIGALDGDGDLSEYHADSRRFEPYPQEELTA